MTQAEKAGTGSASSEPCYILAVETSCDETAVSVVKNGTEVLSNLISSQIETHKAFGGVVPEVASRKHVESITYMLDEAMQTSGISPVRFQRLP